MNEFSFKEIVKGGGGTPLIDESTVRIRGTSITLSQDIASRFLGDAQKIYSGYKIMVRILVDKENNAIKLDLPINGIFSQSLYARELQTTYHGNMVKDLIRSGLQSGDYKELDNHRNIFVLAK